MNKDGKEVDRPNGCVLFFMATFAAFLWLLYAAMDVIDAFLGIK